MNGCPCGESNLTLFRRSDSEKLSIFLKGSKRGKEKLKSEHLDEFDHFENPCACSSALSDQVVPDPTIIDPDNCSEEEAQPEVMYH